MQRRMLSEGAAPWKSAANVRPARRNTRSPPNTPAKRSAAPNARPPSKSRSHRLNPLPQRLHHRLHRRHRLPRLRASSPPPIHSPNSGSTLLITSGDQVRPPHQIVNLVAVGKHNGRSSLAFPAFVQSWQSSRLQSSSIAPVRTFRNKPAPSPKLPPRARPYNRRHPRAPRRQSPQPLKHQRRTEYPAPRQSRPLLFAASRAGSRSSQPPGTRPPRKTKTSSSSSAAPIRSPPLSTWPPPSKTPLPSKSPKTWFAS